MKLHKAINNIIPTVFNVYNSDSFYNTNCNHNLKRKNCKKKNKQTKQIEKD